MVGLTQQKNALGISEGGATPTFTQRVMLRQKKPLNRLTSIAIQRLSRYRHVTSVVSIACESITPLSLASGPSCNGLLP